MKLLNEKLKDLQNFTNPYFDRKQPKVKFAQLPGETNGQAFLIRRVIELDPKKNHSTTGCSIGHGLSIEHTNVTDDKDEALFLSLLHEIGHFLIKKSSTPKEFYVTKQKLTKVIIEEEKVEEKFTGRKKFDEKWFKNNKKKWILIHINALCDLVDDSYLKSKPGESAEDYSWKLERFKQWLIREDPENHHNVEEWALNEFNKQKSAIQKIIKTWK